MLYTLRILQVNFNALIKCQGSLQELLKHDASTWKLFFDVYDKVLKYMANLDIRIDPHSVDCTIFLENFTKPANCEKLLSPEMNKKMIQIFDATCAVQVSYFKANLVGHQN